ncbi:hypothetical protein [Streptomyces sp. KL116D]|uniref:hypothetical protein n=1 Tax=Streptomyces sp. KL116D TaxID=3045152 RepID=UPI0035575723
MNRIRLFFHRIFRRPAVTGPFPIYLRRIPTGVVLDLEAYFEHVVTTIADDEELLALLLEFADDRGSAGAYDGHAPEKLLVEQIGDRVGFSVPVYGEKVQALAERLRSLAPAPAVVIPAQREAGAA